MRNALIVQSPPSQVIKQRSQVKSEVRFLTDGHLTSPVKSCILSESQAKKIFEDDQIPNMKDREEFKPSGNIINSDGQKSSKFSETNLVYEFKYSLIICFYLLCAY